VEGGAALATAFVRGNLADRLHLFLAPILLGAEGLGWLGPSAGPGEPAWPRNWQIVEERTLPPDRLLVLVPQALEGEDPCSPV
jgi:riboflavin biosynthesis pyrimidine reductase